jgi:hypothetical protein
MQARLSAILAALVFTFTWQPACVHAVPVPWNNANGSSPGFFSWQNGSNDVGLFGDPVPVGNSLVFFPSSFFSSSNAGIIPAATHDKINVDIIAEANQAITAINIIEVGDYQINGTGPNTSVNASGTLVVTPLISNGASFKLNALATNPVMPVTAGSGPWNGNASVSYTVQDGVRKIHLTLDNILQARSDPNTSTFIEKKLTQGIIIEVVIPEPGTIGLVLCGAPLLLRRRRND